nr:hypothetical protein [Tanacetum cinerariifolium]
MTPRFKNDNQSGKFGNQRTVNVAAARENVGRMQKAKRVKDSAYQKEKMLLCKQAKQGVPLQAEQYDWLADMDEEDDEQELEAHYSYMAKIQEVPTSDLGIDSEPVEQNDQNDVESDDERVALANLIANLKLDVDENKKIQKQLKKANATLAQELKDDDECVALANLIANLKLDVDENKKIQKKLKQANTTLAHELKECKTIIAETSKTLGESNSVRDSCLVALQNK